MRIRHIIFLLFAHISLYAQNVVKPGCPDVLPDIPVVFVDCTDGEYPTVKFEKWENGMIYKTEAPYKTARIQVKLRGETLFDSGEYTDSTGGKIKVRGNTSSQDIFPSYKIKLTNKADILDFGYKEKSWILLKAKPACGNTLYLFDEVVGFKVADMVGIDWSPNTRIVNVVMNGDYRGIYVLSDPVDRGKNRVDIEKTGFIIENDPYWFGEERWFDTSRSKQESMDVRYTFKYPDVEDVTDSIQESIQAYMEDFENALYSGADVSEYIDMRSFAATLLAHDILGSKDTAGSNIFLHKKNHDKDNPFASKLVRGPLWDLDGICQVDDRWTGYHTCDDSYNMELLKKREFVDMYCGIWNEVRGSVLDEVTAELERIRQESGEALQQSALLDYEYCVYAPQNVDEEIAHKTEWLANRIAWIDEHISDLYDGVSVIIENPFALKVADNSYYNLQGQRVSKPVPGSIYIHKGRKVVR